MPARRKAVRLLLGTLAVYALLVATHRGEFWPFSIYPMFSQAGQPWSRTVVRTVEAGAFEAGAARWRETSLGALPGQPFALDLHGVDQTDLSNFVSKTRRWDADRTAALHALFDGQFYPGQAPEKESVHEGRGRGRSFLVLRADGRLTEADSVAVSFVPYALLRPDTTLLNPRLPR